MFVVILNYIKPLAEVDKFLPEHVDYLKAQYAQGTFLLSGRKVPRSGGVILVRDMPLAAVKGILKDDPFSREGVAEYSITEFSPSMGAEEFSGYLV